MYNRSTPWIAFAPLKQDGAVVTWGDSWYGGDSSTVSSPTSNVQQILTVVPLALNDLGYLGQFLVWWRF